MTSLATLSFLLSFAAWGLIGGLASVFAGAVPLDGLADGAAGRDTGLAGIARPPADGAPHRSLRRARRVHAAARVLAPSPRGSCTLDNQLPVAARRAFFIGLAGSSFAVGAAFVSQVDSASTAGRGARASTGSAISGNRWPCLAADHRRPVWLGNGVPRRRAVLLLAWAARVFRARDAIRRRPGGAGSFARDGRPCSSARRPRGCSARSTS